METALVLVIRSMCLFSSNDRTNANYGDNGAVRRRMLQQTLTSLPLSCDITVLPEIPMDVPAIFDNYKHVDGRGSNDNKNNTDSSLDDPRRSLTPQRDQGDNILLMKKHEFHPCGMDNFILLQDLPLAGGNPPSYLVSITSCESVVTHLDTPHGGVMEMEHPISVKVQSVPSTFSFILDGATSIGNKDNNDILVKPRAASTAELNAKFDFSLALHSLEGVAKEMIDTHAINVRRVVETAVQAPVHLLKDGRSREAASSSLHPHHDQILHVLREAAEKEAHRLDWMLASFALVFVLLVAHYVKTISPLTHSKRDLKKRSSSFVDDRKYQSSNATDEYQPPIKSASFKRSISRAVPMSSVAPEQCVATDVPCTPSRPFAASESIIYIDESPGTSACHDQEFAILPLPNNKKATSPVHTSPTNDGRKELSPCSKLAQRWMQMKENRRESRKESDPVTPRGVIRPFPEVHPCFNQRAIHETALELPVLADEPNPVDVKKNATETSPILFHFLPQSKVAMLDTRPVGKESFLHDYWGE